MRKREKITSKRFGTFEGVFTPSILTILGVIMYLRLGWVVGNAGVGGAILIILLAKIVTITTGLSIASMATNIKVGAGGSYALISRSLGLEIGSSVGIPLYLSQALGGAMYITGFTEAWIAIFPQHNHIMVSSIVLFSLFVISMISAKIAMKVQYLIMAVITVSLVSFFMGRGESSSQMVVWGGFNKASFWVVFSIFFPAVTGIEAGAAMSGDLADPRKSLKTGILTAIFISTAIYILMAVWLNKLASSDTLMNNYTVVMELARWKYLVVAGIFGATLSSALGSMVGGPRTLMALGQDRVVPFSGFFAKQSRDGEPRNAIVFSAIVVQVCLLLGDLNTIAPLLTMFFLITYGTINLAVLIEQGTGISSFRPSFKLPIAAPLIGTSWCFIVMIFINPYFAVSAMIVLLLVYIIQTKRGITTPWGDVRRALFVSIAEWATKTAAAMPRTPKSWKPNLIIPIEDPKKWSYLLEFVRDVTLPGGTLRLFSIQTCSKDLECNEKLLQDVLLRKKRDKDSGNELIDDETKQLDETKEALNGLADSLRKDGVFTAAMVLESSNFIEGASLTAQVMKGMFFPPNILFLTMSQDLSKDQRLEKLIAVGIRENLGVIVLAHHHKASFGRRKLINVWLRSRSRNVNLALLCAMRLARNWYAEIQIISVAEETEDSIKKQARLAKMIGNARMPPDTKVSVMDGDFKSVVQKAPMADLNIFGLPDEINCEAMHGIFEKIDASCLFILDSGEERVWS